MDSFRIEQHFKILFSVRPCRYLLGCGRRKAIRYYFIVKKLIFTKISGGGVTLPTGILEYNVLSEIQINIAFNLHNGYLLLKVPLGLCF